MSDLVIDQDGKSDGYKVTLPCNPNEFADFVSSLLGKGLQVEKNYSDIFALDAVAIKQLYHIIIQRANQNAGKLVSFNSKIYFNDRSNISFNSPSDLFGHNEIKKISTTALSLELVFLIHFPDTPTPMKQTVSFFFKTGTILRHRGEYVDVSNSEITLQINHSDKTWANDIVNLFNDFISHHILTPTKVTAFWNKINKYVSGVAGFMCFGAGLLGIVFGYNFVLKKIESAALLALPTTDKAVQFLVKQSYDPILVNFFVSSVFYVGLLIFLSVFVGEKLEKYNTIPITSRLLFTDEDKRKAEKYERKILSKFWSLSLELLKGISIGLIANALFATFWH